MRNDAMRMSLRGWVLALVAVVGIAACAGEGMLTADRTATVAMRFLTPATVRSLVVAVSGPGIDPAVVLNLPVGADSTATGSLTLPAGSARRFVVTAVDTAGVETHRADTTITLQPGANPNLAMRLEPLASSLGITVTFGGIRLVVPDTSTRVLNVGDTTVIQAYAIRTNGDTMPRDSMVWGSSNPAVGTVALGLVRAAKSGVTTATVSVYGTAIRVYIVVGSNGGFAGFQSARRYRRAFFYDWDSCLFSPGIVDAAPLDTAPSWRVDGHVELVATGTPNVGRVVVSTGGYATRYPVDSLYSINAFAAFVANVVNDSVRAYGNQPECNNANGLAIRLRLSDPQ